MDPELDTDENVNASDLRYKDESCLTDAGNDIFCTACMTEEDCSPGFEKMLNFENVGIIIYRRLQKHKQLRRSKKGKMDTFKTVIVRNTSDMDFTSEDFIREMQKKEISCNRCSHIIDLALKLLQKVPALNKKAIMGICDRCKLTDPCRVCNETTKSFLSKYKIKENEEQLPQRLNVWEDAANVFFPDNTTANPTKVLESTASNLKSKSDFSEGNAIRSPKKWEYTPSKDFLNKEAVEPPKKFLFSSLDDFLHKKVVKTPVVSESFKPLLKSKSEPLEKILDVKAPKKFESALRIEELLRREWDKSKRYIEVNDLCPPPTPQSTKSLPTFNISKKFSRSKQTAKTIDEPSTDYTGHKVGKSIVDKFETLTIKSIPSDDNNLNEYPKKQGYIRTTNLDTHQQSLTKTIDKHQIEKRKHDWKHEDGDIFPEHPKPYAHVKETSPLVTFDNENIDYEHVGAIDKKHVKVKKKSIKKPSDMMPSTQTSIETRPEQGSGLEPYSIIKKGIEKPARKPKLRVIESDEFIYSFPFDKPKIKNEPVQEKDSIELVKEVQDKARIRAEMRLQKETELEKKRLEKEGDTEVIAQKKAAAEKVGIAIETTNELKSDELSHVKEAIETKEVKNDEISHMEEGKKTKEVNEDKLLKNNKFVEQRLSPKIESKAQEDQLKYSSKGITTDKARKSSIKEKEGALLKKDQKDILSKPNKEEPLSKTLSHIEEAKKTKEVNQDKLLKKKKHAEQRLSPTIEPKAQDHELKSSSTSITTDKALKSSIKRKEKALLKKDHEYILAKPNKEETLSKQKKGMLSKKDKETTLSKKEKEEMARKEKLNALLRGEKENTQLDKQKEKKNVHKKQKEQKDEYEDILRKMKITSGKKQKESDNVVIKGTSKVPKPLKQLQEFGLRDMTQKNVFKRKDATELARLQTLNDKKREDSEKSKNQKKTNETNETKKTKRQNETKKTKREENMLDMQIKLHKIKHKPSKPEKVCVEFKAMGLKYKYKGKTLREHWNIHEKRHKFKKDPACPFCLNSDLEIQDNLKNRQVASEYIQGKKIVEANKLHDTTDGRREPLLFSTYYEVPKIEIGDNEKKPLAKPEKPKHADKKEAKMSGVINYALSDHTFIDKGWTVLPTEKVMRKMNVYRMRPAKPEFDWFKRNKEKPQMFYDSGELFAQHEDDGRCRWFYKNQRLALDYYQAEEANVHQRFVIYSNGEPDEHGRARPYTILAMFDHLGNGVVFDHAGKIRLKYNQTEGIMLDRSLGPVSHWQWHSLNDPPELQKVMIDTQLHHKDPDILAMDSGSRVKLDFPRDSLDEMLTIEFDNVIREKGKKLSQNFRPFQIKMKAMKINEHFSLKVLDQANIFLIYRDGMTNIKLNLGMLLDHKEIVDTDTVEVGEVDSSLERLPARTDSLAAMQERVEHTKHFDKTQLEYEEKLRRPGPRFSVDKMTAAISRPKRVPLSTINSSTEISTTNATSPIKRNQLTNGFYCSY